MSIVFEGIGAFVVWFLLGAGLVVVYANITTSERDKRENGGIDLSWYVGALLVGLIGGAVGFGFVLGK